MVAVVRVNGWWGWLLVICNIFIFVLIVTGLLVLGLEALKKPYFLSPIGIILNGDGAYLAVMGKRRNLRKLTYVGGIFVVIGWVALFLSVVFLVMGHY